MARKMPRTKDVSAIIDSDSYYAKDNAGNQERYRHTSHFNPDQPLGDTNRRLKFVGEQNNSQGVDFDSGWDGVWISEARITQDGWSATVEIPFPR